MSMAVWVPVIIYINMKTLFLIASLLSVSLGIFAQQDNKMDKAAIARALEDVYFKGIYEGNVELLSQLYYKGTLLFGDVKGQPYAKTLDEYLDGVAHRVSPKDSGKPFKGDIISIDVVNSIAVAKVHVKMYDFNYDEFLSFHKMDGKWFIVNKMISDIK